MALQNYADLKQAVEDEFRRDTDTKFIAKIPDLITRGESRLNSVLRLRARETVTTSTYDSSVTDRRVDLPVGFVELLSLKIKESSEEDRSYLRVQYIDPDRFHSYIQDGGDRPQRYTITDKIELDMTTNGTYTLRYHYIKRWDLATDSTNWLMTNHPEVYLYASLIQAALHLRGDHLKLIAVYKPMLEDELRQLNIVDQRSRDDAQLDTYDFTAGRYRRSTYNILTDRY